RVPPRSTGGCPATSPHSRRADFRPPRSRLLDCGHGRALRNRGLMLEEEYAPRRRLPAHLRKPVEPEAPFAFSIRAAVEADLPYVREIYNYYVRNSTVTFDEKPLTLRALRSRFAQVQ